MKQYESCGCMSEKLWQNSRESYRMCFKNEVAHTCQISTKCAHSQILFIKFDVRSKHAFTTFFLVFTRYAQQTENAFAAAYSTKMTVWCIDECYDLVFPLDLEKLFIQFRWNLFSPTFTSLKQGWYDLSLIIYLQFCIYSGTCLIPHLFKKTTKGNTKQHFCIICTTQDKVIPRYMKFSTAARRFWSFVVTPHKVFSRSHIHDEH